MRRQYRNTLSSPCCPNLASSPCKTRCKVFPEQFRLQKHRGDTARTFLRLLQPVGSHLKKGLLLAKAVYTWEAGSETALGHHSLRKPSNGERLPSTEHAQLRAACSLAANHTPYTHKGESYKSLGRVGRRMTPHEFVSPPLKI